MDSAEISMKDIVHSRYSAVYSRSYSKETFQELTKSIRRIGVNSPIVVTRKNKDGMHVIIDGDHRLEAAKEAGLETIPAYIDETVDPDNSNYKEKALNYIHNTQRVNLSTYESACLFRMLFRDCNFEQLEEAKAIMGISKSKTELFDKLNVLDYKTAEWLDQKKMDSCRGVIDALLAIRSPKDREDTISLADSIGIQEWREMEDFLKSVGFILGNFPDVIRIHFNARELPYSRTVAEFLLLYPDEESILKAVDKLNSVPAEGKTKAAGQLLRLLKGIDPGTGEIKTGQACPELLDLVPRPAFPYDETTVSAIIRFRSLFPDDPEKRLCIITDLLGQNRLTEDDLIRLTRSIEKFFVSYPEEVRAFFWNGSLRFSDACFRILNILLEKTYDLPTKLEMIENACAGKPSPEQFENRLSKAIKERDEMIRDVALQTNTDPASLKNDEDIMRTAGFPEEDIERIKAEKNSSRSEKSAGNGCRNDAPAAYVPDEADGEDLPSREEKNDYLLLADSMARSQGTDKLLELELLENGENEPILLSKLYRLANKTCTACRKERVFKFDTVNYCEGCMLARLIGEVEDSVGED